MSVTKIAKGEVRERTASWKQLAYAFALAVARLENHEGFEAPRSEHNGEERIDLSEAAVSGLIEFLKVEAPVEASAS